MIESKCPHCNKPVVARWWEEKEQPGRLADYGVKIMTLEEAHQVEAENWKKALKKKYGEKAKDLTYRQTPIECFDQETLVLMLTEFHEREKKRWDM